MNNRKLIMPFIMLASLMASCDRSETDHPEHGKIISLNVAWDNRGAAVDIPGNYAVRIGDYSATLSGTAKSVNNLFPAGAYHINIWNVAAGVTVNGTTATADYSGGLLGWFFTGVADQTIEADKDYTVNVEMRQQVRELTLSLEMTGAAAERITAIDATLAGVAGAIDINSGNPTGNPVTVALDFIRRDAQLHVATIRLLGVVGDTQTLSLTLHFAAGNPQSYPLTSDLSTLLAAFNADKKTPLTLQSILTETPTGTGFEASVADWIHGGTTGGEAE